MANIPCFKVDEDINMNCDSTEIKHIGKRIHIVSNQIRRRMDSELSKFGLTHSQNIILSYLAKNSHRDIFQKDIEEEFDIRRSSVSSILSHLEEKGYVSRQSVDYDARLRKLTITKAGLETVMKMHSVVVDFEKSIEKVLSNEEIDTLFRLLDKLSEIANRRDDRND